ncbi:MAG: type II toxin-antitoxin system HicB family antitoxin, partial [Nitrospinae bacterium]|nr:type II toxin-antitoxin system HicB family antitoxin [Nitrospinota bacterium]
MARRKAKIKPCPAVFEPFERGYGVYFPDLPGAGTSGDDYEDAMRMGKECLSLHLYGLLKDGDPVPE